MMNQLSKDTESIDYEKVSTEQSFSKNTTSRSTDNPESVSGADYKFSKIEEMKDALFSSDEQGNMSLLFDQQDCFPADYKFSEIEEMKDALFSSDEQGNMSLLFDQQDCFPDNFSDIFQSFTDCPSEDKAQVQKRKESRGPKTKERPKCREVLPGLRDLFGKEVRKYTLDSCIIRRVVNSIRLAQSRIDPAISLKNLKDPNLHTECEKTILDIVQQDSEKFSCFTGITSKAKATAESSRENCSARNLRSCSGTW